MKKLKVWRVWYEKNHEKISKDVKDWKLKNPEKVRIQRERSRERRLTTTRAWRKNNREKYLAGSRVWYQKNIEKVRSWHQKNREKQNARSKSWRLKNLERSIILGKNWRLNNPDKTRAYWRIHHEKTKHISPINIILNERFKGSELHHTGVEMDGGFIGIYIPRSLNRGHCAQLGKERNLDRANYDALEFLAEEWE